MHRCFVEDDFNMENPVEITGDEAAHISRVLRLSAGDEVELFNGSGKVARAELKEVSKQGIEAEIKSIFESDAEPKVKAVLFQGIAKKQKWIL